MSLFPQLGTEYYDEKDRGMLSRMEAFYAESITVNQSFWGEADTDTRFETGDQSLWSDIYGNLPANRRRTFNFNRIRRVVQMISGHQRRNRKSTIVEGRENSDAHTSDQFTRILMEIADQEGVLETISEAFTGALITGMNLLHVWVDYRNDPVSGNIRVDNCSYNSFLIDPFFRKADLSDCQGIWKRSFLTKRECLTLMPSKQDEIMALQGHDSRDGKFQFMPENYNYGMKNLLTYDEFYYRDYRKQKLLVDTQTGEVMEWRSDNKDRLRQYLATYPTVTVLEQDIPTVKLAIVIQGKVFYDDVNPAGIDVYPFVPMLGYFRPELPYFPWRVQGVVRGLRDSQFLYNRRKIIELDILESQVNSGFIYKENALVNPKDVFQAGQGKGIALKDNALISDVVPIQPPQVPPSMIQLSELLGREIQEISGVSDELLGSAQDDKAGILSMLRQGAGLTTLQTLFDQLDRSQKLLGKIMIDLIQANYTPGKIKLMLEGEEPAPQFYSKAFGKYDASVVEGLNTTSQKQMQLMQMIQLREIGVPIPDASLLDACTLQNKDKVIQQIEQQQQQAQQAQQLQVQAEIGEIQARTELAHARSVSDQGLGLERLSRIQENKMLAVERQAQAKKEDNEALLNLIKAIKEIDGMDIEHIERMIRLTHEIENHNNPELGNEEKVAAGGAGVQERREAPRKSTQARKQTPRKNARQRTSASVSQGTQVS